jgi:predicted SnoaL-like aldol condensation-catalyzing enzyme
MDDAKGIIVQYIKNGEAGIPGTTELIRVLVDGDKVVVHGEFLEDAAKKAMFCVLTLEGNHVVQARATSQDQPAQTVSGRTMVDGPAEIDDQARTASNKELVRAMISEILIGGNFTRITEYFSTEQLDQHNPMIGDGLAGLQAAMAAMAEQGITMKYDGIQLVVGEGSFVFAQSAGSFAGKSYLFCDLYRVKDNKIVEHWDVMAEDA